MMWRLRRRALSALAWAAACMCAPGQGYLISTVAGGAPPPTPVAATSAAVGQPLAVTSDAAGNVYFLAFFCIFKIDASGTLTRIAGNGRLGYSGDGGPATQAELGFEVGLAADSQGNIYAADSGFARIRRISPEGVITTIAGTGIVGVSGDGGPAASARLEFPLGAAADSQGNLFIADEYVIRKVSPNGLITTVAGNGTSGFSGDGGTAIGAQLNSVHAVAVDQQGNVFIADSGNSRIRKVSPAGIITTVAGGGTTTTGDGGLATSVSLLQPQGVAVDAQGDFFILEKLANRVRKVAPDGTITTVGGNGRPGFSGDGGPATSAALYEPSAIAIGGGNIFIADNGNSRIREISTDGTINTIAGSGATPESGDGGPATAAVLDFPSGVAADSQGNFYIADQFNNRVRKVTPAGIISTFAGGAHCGFSGDGGPAASAELCQPDAIAVDGQGNVFISDSGTSHVRKVSASGVISTVAGNGKYGYAGDGGPATSASLVDPSGLAVDGQGNLFIADWAASVVRKVTSDGTISTVAGTGGVGNSGDGGAATNAELAAPTAVAVDQQGDLFIADANNSSIRKVSASGIISTFAGKGTFGYSGDGGLATGAQLFGPEGVAVDAQGNVYIGDSGNERIRKVSPSGIITTIAGTGNQGYSGDGGPAITAEFGGPRSLALDTQGNLYVADVTDSSVRRLQPTNQSVIIGAIVDAASQRAIPVSPGKIVVLYGAGLGPAGLVQNQPSGGVFSTQLAGTTVSFNGIAGPVIYTSGTQVAAIVPYGITGAAAQVIVSYQGQSSVPFSVAVAPSAPSLFTLNQTGGGQAAAINAADGSINTAANPVKVGGYISLFATGEGQTTPVGADGKIASDPVLPQPNLRVSATVGGLPAMVQYAGAAPGEVAGLMQMNVQIPTGVQAGGYVPVTLQVGSAGTVAGAVWVAVAN